MFASQRGGHHGHAAAVNRAERFQFAVLPFSLLCGCETLLRVTCVAAKIRGNCVTNVESCVVTGVTAVVGMMGVSSPTPSHWRYKRRVWHGHIRPS